jgi:hypothetical protein
MVRKLFKHEFLSYARIMLPIYAVLIGVSGVNRIVQLFEQDNIIYNIAFVSSIIAYAVTIILALVLTTITAVTRYYKNLFSGEGYLSFTLPVTPAAHLWVKSLTVIAIEIITIVVILLSVSVITAGDVLTEVFKAIGYLCGRVFESVGAHFWFYIAEFIFLLLITSLTSIMMFYFCITVGQLAKKNRVLAAVGVYFGLYILSQVVSTIGMILLTVFGEPLGEFLLEFLAEHPFASAHWIFGIIALANVVMSAVYFLVNRAIIKNKLNLE